MSSTRAGADFRAALLSPPDVPVLSSDVPPFTAVQMLSSCETRVLLCWIPGVDMRPGNPPILQTHSRTLCSPRGWRGEGSLLLHQTSPPASCSHLPRMTFLPSLQPFLEEVLRILITQGGKVPAEKASESRLMIGAHCSNSQNPPRCRCGRHVTKENGIFIINFI